MQTNSHILKSLLKGEGKKSHKDVVALNTALVLWAAGIEDDLSKGLSTSLNCLNEGLPWQSLERLTSALGT